MADLDIRMDRHAGRITLTRPKTLNALSHDMILTIESALDSWRGDDALRLVIIDAAGDRAFCAGADVAQVHSAAQAGDHGMGQRFFADEYRMNAKLANFPKPVVALMQGYVLGGGVGLGGHASHRIVGDTTRMGMPEVGIGFVPDVGGSWLLARAPGRTGEYLGLTGTHMTAGDAIFTGFADFYIPEAEWPALIENLAETGSTSSIHPQKTPPAPLEKAALGLWGQDLATIEAGADGMAAQALARASPLSKAAALALIRASRGDRRIEQSLSREYRFAYRATTDGDMLEGVRAQLIDKDHAPQWTAASDRRAVEDMLAPLGPHELTWPETPS